jgi:methionyl-tRNA formyltransferase
MNNSRLRIVFMGTPAFSAAILKALSGWEGGIIAGVYTQPDKGAGRGMKITPSPVKVLAQSLDLPVFQPVNFKDDGSRAQLVALAPDILAVAAYGLILPQAVLDIPRIAPLNVHASLLPLYRGAAPIQRAIMDGRQITGITIMRMQARLDAGPVVHQRAMGIGFDETASDLHDQLANFGGQLLLDVLEDCRKNVANLPGMPQDDSLATYAPKLEKKDGKIDWRLSALGVHALMRGVSPWPGAQAVFAGSGAKALPVLLMPGKIGEPVDKGIMPGAVRGLEDGHLAVACRDAWYLTPQLQPQGRKWMDAVSFWNGYALRDDARTGWRMETS